MQNGQGKDLQAAADADRPRPLDGLLSGLPMIHEPSFRPPGLSADERTTT